MRLISIAVFLVTAVGCDPLAAPDYFGTPIVTVHGVVTSDVTNPPPLDAALAWLKPDGDNLVETVAEIDAGFPQALTLALFNPPRVDDEYLPGIAIAHLYAFRAGSLDKAASLGGGLSTYDMYGRSESVLVHVADTYDPEIAFADSNRVRPEGLVPGFQVRRRVAEESFGWESVAADTAINLHIGEPGAVELEDEIR